jgi:hypothetical protein
MADWAPQDGQADQFVNAGQDYAGVGTWNAGFTGSALFAFQLPAIPDGEQITKVEFSAYFAGTFWGSRFWTTGLYGGRHSATANTDLLQDFGNGPGQSGQILADWLGVATPGAYTAPVDVTAFVTSGYVAGNYVFLRGASSDKTSAELGVGSQFIADCFLNASYPARLTITTAPVPEPTMVGLLAVVGMLGLRRRTSARASG